MNVNKRLIEIVIEKYNEIFENRIEGINISTWYHEHFGSYGAQEIKVKKNKTH